MRILNLELRGLDDWVLTGMLVNLLPTGSDFPPGLSFPVVSYFILHYSYILQDGTIYPQTFRKRISRKFTVFSQTIMGPTRSGLAGLVPITVVFSTPRLAGHSNFSGLTDLFIKKFT